MTLFRIEPGATEQYVVDVWDGAPPAPSTTTAPVVADLPDHVVQRYWDAHRAFIAARAAVAAAFGAAGAPGLPQ